MRNTKSQISHRRLIKIFAFHSKASHTVKLYLKCKHFTVYANMEHIDQTVPTCRCSESSPVAILVARFIEFSALLNFHIDF